MGCGKARLSLAVSTVLPAAKLVLVDRARNRNKVCGGCAAVALLCWRPLNRASHTPTRTTSAAPRRHRRQADKFLRKARTEFSRVYIDITHLDLGAVPALAGKSVVCISKHLCGMATDVTLGCLRRLCESRSSHPDRPSLAGLGIATCCHHRCTWRDYVGKRWWTSVLVRAPPPACERASVFCMRPGRDTHVVARAPHASVRWVHRASRRKISSSCASCRRGACSRWWRRAATMVTRRRLRWRHRHRQGMVPPTPVPATLLCSGAQAGCSPLHLVCKAALSCAHRVAIASACVRVLARLQCA